MSSDRWLVWALPLAMVVATAIVVPALALEPEGWPRYRALRDELERVSADNARLTSEVRALDRDVRRLRADESAIEKVARDELGMIREGEVVVQFPD